MTLNHRDIKIAQHLYELSGPTAVYDYANRRKWQHWRYCAGCDAVTPVVNEVCLVCSSAV